MSLKQKLSQRWQALRQAANLMAGLPDYANYVARQRRHNPNAPVMSEQQFQDYCSKRRCGSNGGKCC
ncbi:MAG: CstA-like transporter-associated (seleno)protein [Neisseria sp.]|uniref:YbdD/YjiX family protein n=1 Tax=Neisseria sp. TaxID=192066 RepID=UPI0026DC1915|nr:CstA-like transporter-associated (seleno)protein [Neisseria sp.]MDO4248326.1 CstA-like transporter-associated (seleno)protein [Neisseria sp.]